MSTTALRDSLRAHGQWLDVFVLGGVVVDGARRKRLLQELGRTPRLTHLKSHAEAARVLWQLHPVQAWQEYGAGKSIREAVEFFGVAPSDIAKIRNVLREPPKSELGHWRARYRLRYESAQRYLGRVRQGLEPLTLGGIESALKLPPFKG